MIFYSKAYEDLYVIEKPVGLRFQLLDIRCSCLSSLRILNKLTPDKFDKLCNELLGVGIETKYILKGVILLVSVFNVIQEVRANCLAQILLPNT